MARTSIDDLSIVLSASSQQLAGDLRAAARLVEGFRKTVDKASADGAASVTRNAAKESAAHRRAATESASAWKRHMGGAAAPARLAAVTAGASFAVFSKAAEGAISLVRGGFADLKEAVNLAADLEMTTLAFEVMLKSGEKATQMLKEIRKFAAETPFNNQELTDASRKLLAYGIAADQVLPTLRMLGDVSSATQTPIGDLSFLYGTLAAQQRAYSRDIYQFANRGIPIYEELAKVLGKTVAETKDLVEEGRVGFPEVVRAFKSMTEGGGRYAGLTSRQADTFAGVREQAMDALQVMKIKLGNVLIDELGLKQGAKDFGAFAANVEAHLDRIRPAVRFVGDMARSWIQIGYEIGKAAVNAGELTDRISTIASPELRKAVEDMRAFLTAGKDFRLSPQAVNDAVFAVAESLTQLFIDLLKNLNALGVALDRNVVEVIRGGVAEIFRLYVESKKFLGRASAGERFYPPQPFDTPDTTRERYRAMMAEAGPVGKRHEELKKVAPIIDALPGTTPENRALKSDWEKTKRDFAEFEAAQNAFLDAFGPRADRLKFNHQLLMTNEVPPRTNAMPTVVGDRGPLAQGVREAEQRLAKIRELRGEIAGQLADDQRRKADEAAAVKARESLIAVAGGAAFAARELKTIERPEVPWQIRADVQDAAQRSKKEFGDPARMFRQEYDALSEALVEGLIDNDTYARAAADLVRRTTDKFGIGGQVRLPDAAMKDTTESVRILNQFHSGQMKAEDFLQQLVRIAEQNLDVDRELLRKTIAPAVVPIPK